MKFASFTEVRGGSLVLPLSHSGRSERWPARAIELVRVSLAVSFAGETAREQWVSRDIAADGEGKALKTRILWAEVA
jgi:hypothetical protein